MRPNFVYLTPFFLYWLTVHSSIGRDPGNDIRQIFGLEKVCNFLDTPSMGKMNQNKGSFGTSQNMRFELGPQDMLGSVGIVLTIVGQKATFDNNCLDNSRSARHIILLPTKLMQRYLPRNKREAVLLLE